MKRETVFRNEPPVFGFQKFLFAVSLFLLIVNFFPNGVRAQDEPNVGAPPPLKIVSKEEKKQLDAEPDVNKRTKLSLILIEARLKQAEDFYARQQFRAMFEQLGSFHALIDEALGFLNRNDAGKGKVLGSFKRFEMNLRAFLPRLEIIRRDLPGEFEPYVKSLAKEVRQARAEAIEPFFGETVVKENKND